MAKHRFVKGNTYGNRGGRPRGSSYVQRCQQWADAKGWDQLISWAEGNILKSEFKAQDFARHEKYTRELQFQAMKLVFEYGYGKPRQQMDIDHHQDDDLKQLTADSIKELIGALKE